MTIFMQSSQKVASLCGSVGKDFVYHVCGHEFESRLKWKFSNFPHHLWLMLSDCRGTAKWFGAHYNQEVRFSSAISVRKETRSQLRCLTKDEIIFIII